LSGDWHANWQLAFVTWKTSLQRTKYLSRPTKTLKRKSFFTKAIDMAAIEWNSASNTIVRTQLEAAATFERDMLEANAIAFDPKTPFNHTVEYMKLLSDVGGVKKQPNQGQPGERFQITINLGADTKLEFEGSQLPLGGNPDTVAALPVPQTDDRDERV
jgi:hypothetical protein